MEDADFNVWARRLSTGRDGHIYDWASTNVQICNGVNTPVPVNIVQEYMNDDSFAFSTVWSDPLSLPRWNKGNSRLPGNLSLSSVLPRFGVVVALSYRVVPAHSVHLPCLSSTYAVH